MSSEIQQLAREVEELKQCYLHTLESHETLTLQCEEMVSRYRQAQRRSRVMSGMALAAIVGAILLSPSNRQAIAHAQGAVFPGIFARLSALEAKTQFQSVDPVAKSTIFSGCNVFVNDGSGNTGTLVQNDAGQGLGNLIIGYNETGNNLGDGDIRTGSHNLIVGQRNNYSSFGGLIAGNGNAISNRFATVTGGEFNIASGQLSSVTAGVRNIASGFISSVTGGEFNTASGAFASVSGGEFNTASGFFSSISGGGSNTASGFFSSISGGGSNTASNQLASVSGGLGITQDISFGWSAGEFHTP